MCPAPAFIPAESVLLVLRRRVSGRPFQSMGSRASQDAGSARLPSAYATYFNSPDYADLVLRVSSDSDIVIEVPKPTTAGHKSCSLRKILTSALQPLSCNNTPAPTTAVAAPAARTYHAHSIVLGAQSGYFRAQLSSAWTPPLAAGGTSSPSAANARRTVDIHAEAEELDAMHELLRMMYSQAAPAVTPTDPAYAKCLRLADRFEATGCMEILIWGLAAAPMEGCLPLKEVFEASPGVCVSASYPALLESCSKALVRLFGDAPAVIGNKTLLQQFCSLPHAAVLAWVQSNDLKVHSENCVVLLLSAWVQANPGSTAQQHEELAQHIRVFHLGPAYLHQILPGLTWFKGCSCAEYLPPVLSCISAGMTMKKGMDAEKSKIRLDCLFNFSPGWLAKPRSSSSSPTTCSWVLSPGQLKDMSEGETLELPSPVSVNGFLMKLVVEQVPPPPSALAAGQTLGLFQGVDGAAMEQHGLALPGKLLVWYKAPLIELGSLGSEKVAKRTLFNDFLRQAHTLPWGSADLLDAAAPTLMEQLTPYLDAGQLHIRASVYVN